MLKKVQRRRDAVFRLILFGVAFCGMSVGQLVPAICLVGGSMYRHSNNLAYQKSASVIGLLLALVLMFDFHVNQTRLLPTLLSCGATGFFLADRHWVDVMLSIVAATRILWRRQAVACRRRRLADNSTSIVNPNSTHAASSVSESSKAEQPDEQSWYVVLPLVSSSKSPVRCEGSQ